MKLTTLFPLIVGANAHTIFQALSVDSKVYGELEGLRAPTNDYPVQDVNDPNMACGQPGSTSGTVIEVPAGSRVGALWGHVIGGEQYANDPDDPIAASHKGPIMYYLAPVSSASGTSTSGLSWFKIGEDGFDTSSVTWGVDNMIANDGWSYVDMPSCIADGEYLLRVELLALHSAYDVGGGQFYQSCAQIRVTGGGSFDGSSAEMVKFPGAYAANDPGIMINIWGDAGQPDNAFQPYPVPGPSPISC